MESLKLKDEASNLWVRAVTYIYQDIPKNKAIYKNHLDETLVSLMECICTANIFDGQLRLKAQREALRNIAMIEIYLNILLKYNLLKSKEYKIFVNKLITIRMMIYGWINQDEKKK
jgi:hypothetical protein